MQTDIVKLYSPNNRIKRSYRTFIIGEVVIQPKPHVEVLKLRLAIRSLTSHPCRLVMARNGENTFPALNKHFANEIFLL